MMRHGMMTRKHMKSNEQLEYYKMGSLNYDATCGRRRYAEEWQYQSQYQRSEHG
jgi:hypothetical protein